MTMDSWLAIAGLLLIVVSVGMIYLPAAGIVLGAAFLFAAARWPSVQEPSPAPAPARDAGRAAKAP